MVTQIVALLATLSVALPLFAKLALVLGALGSALEALGLFMQRFAHPVPRAIGLFFVRVGKVLEAIGVDAPKLIANALSWILKIKSLLGGGGIATLALVVSIGLLGVAACTAAEAQRNADYARAELNRYCDARAEEQRQSAGGGSAGSAGAP